MEKIKNNLTLSFTGTNLEILWKPNLLQKALGSSILDNASTWNAMYTHGCFRFPPPPPCFLNQQTVLQDAFQT